MQQYAAFYLGIYCLPIHMLSGFVCLFVAVRPKSTAMVMAGWSVHLTTLFSGQAVKQYFVHILSLVTDKLSGF